MLTKNKMIQRVPYYGELVALLQLVAQDSQLSSELQTKVKAILERLGR